MKRIESFCVNHDKLTPGMYVSRIDGDAITYDVRMVVPNAGVYLENDGIHTFEHPYVKHTTKKYNSEKQKTQATKIEDLIAWGFYFCIVSYSKRSWTL